MKIVSIIGSTRRGNTFAMVNAASKAICNDAEVEILMLGDMTYTFCDGCLQCDETGECHIDDDMNSAVEKIKAADGLIIGTPARWGLMSGELKTFFDRLNPLASPELLAGKKAIAFAVGQSEEDTDDAESVRLACASIETFCENADIEVVDRVCVYDCLEKNDIDGNSKAFKQCEAAAIKLLGAL